MDYNTEDGVTSSNKPTSKGTRQTDFSALVMEEATQRQEQNDTPLRRGGSETTIIGRKSSK